MNFSTAWSANAVSIFRSCGLGKVTRAECSRRFRMRNAAGADVALSPAQVTAFAAEVREALHMKCCGFAVIGLADSRTDACFAPNLPV